MNLNIKLLNELFANMKGNYITNNKYSIINYNKSLFKILYFLKKEGYIISYQKNKKNTRIKIYLKYDKSTPFIFFSKVYIQSGNLKYYTFKELIIVDKKHPYLVISTKKGLMYVKQAISLNLGGVILLELKV